MSSSPLVITTPAPAPLFGSRDLCDLDAEQNRMMEEECILVDIDDKAIGRISKRICHKNENIREGMLHRAFSVFLFNTKGELMLQQRAGCKITFPLRWTNTCCSHPLYGTPETEEKFAQGVKRAAIRKLEHELGIKDELTMDDLVYLTKIHYGAESDGEWGEHEIDWILFCVKDVKVNLNPNEVAEIQYVTPQKLKEMFVDQQQKKLFITPWFHLIAEKLLFGWWDKLSAVIQEGGIGEKEKQIIHRLKFE